MSEQAPIPLSLEELATRLERAERRFRVVCGTLIGATTLVVTLPLVSPAVAQGFGVTLEQLAKRVTILETKTASMSVLTDPNTDQPTVRFTGVNVQIVNGLNATNGVPTNPDNLNGLVNGVGNLIIGYNEGRNGEGNSRSGSHNLVVGSGHNYSQFGGQVVGWRNSIMGAYVSVSGGFYNRASGYGSSVSGGHYNTASGAGGTSVSGGQYNTALVMYSSVSGGTGNTASGFYSSVSGGSGNRASGDYSSVSGGLNHSVSGYLDWVAGGLFQDQ